MIRLSIDSAITLYFLITTGFVTGAWIYLIFAKRKKKETYSPLKLHRCEYCLASFLEKDFKKAPRCPTCGSYNASDKKDFIG